VISGYVMADQMKRRPLQFAWDRFSRIYPPFIAAMILHFILTPASIEPVRLAKSLLLWPVGSEVYIHQAWSLGFEAIFYSACALAMFIGGPAVIAIFALLFVEGVPIFGDHLALEFLAGFAIAKRQWWALPLLLLAAPAESRVLTYGVPSAALVWFCVKFERWFQSSRWKPIAMIGGASYAIYITQIAIAVTIARLTNSLPSAAIGAVVGGLMFHFAIEKPLVTMFRNRLAQLRQHGSNQDERPSHSPATQTGQGE
jgi:peptidoglycan/LPS O-acetylase OafA/YrhL